MTSLTRHVNYTSRIYIPQNKIHIAVVRENQKPISFNCDLNLEEFQFDPDAHIRIKAYRQNSGRIFDWGTIQSPSEPDDRSLEDIDTPDVIYFSLNICDNDGRLLGYCPQIRVGGIGSNSGHLGRTALLPVEFQNLGNTPWRIAFEEPEPILLINNAFSESEDFINSPTFSGLVLPSAIYTVLSYIIGVYPELDATMESWEENWVKWARELNTAPCPNADDEMLSPHRIDWINTIVQSFSQKNDLMNKLTSEIDEGT